MTVNIFASLMAAAPSLPYVAGEIGALVVAVILLKRGRGSAERLLVAGFSLMLVSSLIGVTFSVLMPWLFHRGVTPVGLGLMSTSVGLFRSFIGLAGIICLIFAFWEKFKVKSDA